MAAKLLVAKLPDAPAVRCSALVLPGLVVQVTRRLLPSGATDVMRNAEALLVGSVPARNSARLLCPSPSASWEVSAALFLFRPKASSHQSGILSLSKSTMFSPLRIRLLLPL